MTGRWFIWIALLGFGAFVAGLWAYLSGSQELPLRPLPHAVSNAPVAGGIYTTPEGKKPTDPPVRCFRYRRGDRQSIAWRRLATELAQRLDDAAVRFRSRAARSPFVQFVRGCADMQTGKHLAAIEHFDQALARQPDTVPAASAKANALIALGRFEEASEVYRNVLSLAPRDSIVRYNYGVLLYRLGRFAEATKQFRELVRITPDHARGQYNLATLAQRAGRISEARDAWLAFTRLQPDVAGAWFNLGVVWMDFDQPLAAAQCFSRFVDLAPDAPDGWLNLALAYAAVGDLHAALDTLTTADDLLPCNETIMRHLAYLHRLIADQEGESPLEHRRLAALLEEQIAPLEPDVPETSALLADGEAACSYTAP